MQPLTTGQHRSRGRFAAVLIVAALVGASVGVRAQLPSPPNAASQFDITGFLETATLGPGTTGLNVGAGGGALAGGTLTVNGHVVVVPSNTIVIMPATALTWAELFTTAPAPYGGTQTGLALNDSPTPLTTYQVHVVGNKVQGTYIAGLVTISQDSLNTGAGYINFINYATGEIYVGGTTNSPATGARIALNDPVGRFGRVVSPDTRFTADTDNPTVRSVTGYPMCVPRFAPPTNDPLCPQANRKLDPAAPAGFAGVFMMNDYRLVGFDGTLDPRIEAPFEVGDYVTFAGTLVHDGLSPTAGPMFPGLTTYISAHTVINNIAIYTQPGVDPAYTAIDVALMGTGGVTAAGITEAATRTRFEGFTTDSTRIIHIFGIDFSATSNPPGLSFDRDWGLVGVDNGIVALGGAVNGRWRFRPPCTATAVGTNTKGCTPPALGTYVPATREVRAVIQDTGGTIASRTPTANGLIPGQYHAPIAEYIFPEQIPGAPIPPANFETMIFLGHGGYTSAGGFTPNANLNGPFVARAGTMATGALDPWVSDVPPDPQPPLPPSVVINCPTVLASGQRVTCSGANSTVPSGAPATFLWTANKGTFGSPTLAATTYTPPNVTAPDVVTITLTVTDTGTGLSTTVSVNIPINPPVIPTATISNAPISVTSGQTITLNGSCVDNNPARVACNTFNWTLLNAASLPAGITGLFPSPTSTPGANNTTQLRFTPVLPLGQPAVTLQIALVATNILGVASLPQQVNIVVNPVPDQVTVGPVVYRIGKQRFDITATSSVVSTKVILTLQPYLTVNGTILDPGATGIFLNTGGGTYTLTLVGVPEPANGAIVTVTSNLGGSGTSPVTKVR